MYKSITLNKHECFNYKNDFLPWSRRSYLALTSAGKCRPQLDLNVTTKGYTDRNDMEQG